MTPTESDSEALIEARIADLYFARAPVSGVTTCVVRLDNGFQVSAEGYGVEEEEAEAAAYAAALNRLELLFGFYQTELRYQRGAN